jgi:hypothetical protein
MSKRTCSDKQFFVWKIGRLNGLYEKMCLFSWRKFDCYLIRFQKGFQLPLHTDPAPNGYIHNRLNILIYGDDAYVGNYVWKFWRIMFFNAGMVHGTCMLTRPRMLLSFGWLSKERKNG